MDNNNLNNPNSFGNGDYSAPSNNDYVAPEQNTNVGQHLCTAEQRICSTGK